MGASIILATVLVLAGLGLAGAWADLSSAEDELAARTEFVPPNLQAARAGAGPAPVQGQLFVAAASETLAAARLDALVRATVSQAGGSVLSSRAEAKHDDGGLAGRIEVVAEIEGENDVVQDILIRLESGTPWLGVETLAIQPELAGSASDVSSPRLKVDVTFAAYWMPTKP